MITLHTFPARDGLESSSPFCMKVEVYLKLMKLPYKTILGNPMRAPKGKMPFIEQEDGPTVADSSAIIEHLEGKQAQPLDQGMTALEKAQSRVIQRMLEDGLYFVALWGRWAEDAGWAVTKQALSSIPAAVRWAVLPMVRKKVIAQAHAQGTGRHTRDEIYEMGRRDIEALSVLLGERPFFTGDKPRTIDVTAFSFLANLYLIALESPLKEAVKAHPNLVSYAERVRALVTEAAPPS